MVECGPLQTNRCSIWPTGRNVFPSLVHGDDSSLQTCCCSWLSIFSMCRMQIAVWMMRMWAARGWKKRWVVATRTVRDGSSVHCSSDTWHINVNVLLLLLLTKRLMWHLVVIYNTICQLVKQKPIILHTMYCITAEAAEHWTTKLRKFACLEQPWSPKLPIGPWSKRYGVWGDEVAIGMGLEVVKSCS